jgi:hypothetical protein
MKPMIICTIKALSPIPSAVNAEFELPLINPAIKAIGDPNIIEVMNVPIVIGNTKTPTIAAMIKIGSPQKSNVPDQADPIIPIAAKKPISDPITYVRFCKKLYIP